MKNIFKLLFVSFALILVGCEADPDILDVNDSNNSLLAFTTSSTNLSVLQGSGGGSADVQVSISTLSDVDRAFNVNVVTEDSTAPVDGYSVPATVVIPAGEYFGTLTITGNEVPSVTPEATTLVLELTAPDTAISTSRTSVSLFRVCPIPDDYLVGSYQLINTIQKIGPAFGDQNLREATVTLEVGATQSERVFTTTVLPRNSGTPQTARLNLVCGTISLGNTLNYRTSQTLIYIPSQTNQTYDLNDDSNIIVDYIENPNNTNGLSAAPAQFALIKI